MTAHIWSIVVLFAVSLFDTVRPVNLGALALVATFGVGTAVAHEDVDTIISGFPAGIFLLLLWAPFLFAGHLPAVRRVSRAPRAPIPHDDRSGWGGRERPLLHRRGQTCAKTIAHPSRRLRPLLWPESRRPPAARWCSGRHRHARDLGRRPAEPRVPEVQRGGGPEGLLADDSAHLRGHHLRRAAATDGRGGHGRQHRRRCQFPSSAVGGSASSDSSSRWPCARRSSTRRRSPPSAGSPSPTVPRTNGIGSTAACWCGDSPWSSRHRSPPCSCSSFLPSPEHQKGRP